MKSDADKLARVMKVLSVGTRVRIVELLRGRVLCVNALAARLSVTQGAVSQHLRVLRDAGVVIDERRGFFVHYRLNEATLVRWRAAIDALLTPGSAAAPVPAAAAWNGVLELGECRDERQNDERDGVSETGDVGGCGGELFGGAGTPVPR